MLMSDRKPSSPQIDLVQYRVVLRRTPAHHGRPGNALPVYFDIAHRCIVLIIHDHASGCRNVCRTTRWLLVIIIRSYRVGSALLMKG